MDPGLGALFGGAAGGIGGGAISAGLGWAAQEDAQDWQKTMLIKGPKWRRKGLERAGLNPILAAGGGLNTSAPSAPMMRPPDFAQGIASSAKAATAASVGTGQKAALQADARYKDSQTRLAGWRIANAAHEQDQIKANTEKLLADANSAREYARHQAAMADAIEAGHPLRRSREEWDASDVGRMFNYYQRALESTPGFGHFISGAGGGLGAGLLLGKMKNPFAAKPETPVDHRGTLRPPGDNPWRNRARGGTNPTKSGPGPKPPKGSAPVSGGIKRLIPRWVRRPR